jgi:zinc/manganese transport system ATP-binding protein
MKASENIVEISDGTLRFGDRTLWENLSLYIKRGEFIAVLGPNGTGKTTLLKVLLGIQPLTSGTVRVSGNLPGQNNRHIGYIPQQKNFDRYLPIRGRDLVEFGLNGNRFGWHNHKSAVKPVNEAIAMVQATAYADVPIGLLSGGEQQRLRIAQAFVGRPGLLLCDEPLLSLDLISQGVVTDLLNDYRKRTKATIIFVTHAINPILPWVDRVLYIASGQWVIDKPSKVLNSKTLSRLYGSPIEVVKIHGRLLVIGADEAMQVAGAHHEENA